MVELGEDVLVGARLEARGSAAWGAGLAVRPSFRERERERERESAREGERERERERERVRERAQAGRG